jgi:Tfp pilus assembly protein PilZ
VYAPPPQPSHTAPVTPPVIAPQYAQAPQPVYTPPVPQPTLRAAQPIASTTLPSAQPMPQQQQQARPAPAPAARVIPADRPSQPGGAVKVDVELGIHSTSNFYKGLGGNDVIEHGGIFVATYKVLKIGTSVTLRILLPGDYEFTASGLVQWTREAGSSEPGYGARFQQISQEGRQLVYRYTRNREPMFYDDL